MAASDDAEVNAALVDIGRYLLDEIPPLTATDAVQTLMRCPPDLLMTQINAWALQQGRVQGAGMADCLFHALKKVHMISTLNLIEQGPLEGYLNKVIPLALAICPPEDRELLKKNLAALRDQLHFKTPIAVDIERFGGGAPPPQKSGGLSQVASRTAKRLSLVIDRLLRKGPAPAPVSAPDAAADAAPTFNVPVSQLVSMAAESATSEEELNQFVETLKPITGDRATQAKDLIGILATGVPGWEIVADAAAKPSKSIEAMHKVISLTRDPSKSATRFRELMMSAIEQFNSGSLGAAASILDLAEVIVVEKKMDASTVDRIRTDALEVLSSEQLKKYSENKAKHPVLRKFLGFFPTMKKETLLADLRGEQKPERRRAILALLEPYGADVRPTVLAELEKELALPETEADTYYLRNLIYLLHRAPRETDDTLPKEMELLTRASAIGQSIYVIKEVTIPLGQIKTDSSVKLLTTRLAEFEAMLIRAKGTADYMLVEVQKLLDRIINALSRIGTPAALLTIARHGMKANPVLGDTRARLAALSQFDLSFDEQTVNIIIKAIREEMPARSLISRITNRVPPPLRLIEALSGTRSETVEQLFAEIAGNFPEEDAGKLAAAALKNASAKPAAAGRESPTLTGDLQFFGLPALMQSLAEAQATGIVTLVGKDTSQTAGKLLFVKGLFADAMIRNLRGVDAMYQLLERPLVGSFAFVPQASVNTKNEPQPVMPLLFEGIRRHDELKEASVIIPDDLVLKATSVKPTPSEEEKDPTVIREVWVNVSRGGRVGDWEPLIAADSYRVRRLVAHWVEQGALQPQE